MGEKNGKKKLKGQITVLAGLIFGLLVSLLVVMIESVAYTGAKVRINSIVNLGVQSLFSQFSRPLLDRYEVFGGVISDEDEVIATLHGYMKENCRLGSGAWYDRVFDPYGLKIGGINIEEKKMLTDDDGEHFYDEIAGYMKYGQFDNDIMKFLPEMLESSKQDNIKAVNKELSARQKEANKIDAKILRVLMYVEGVKTNSTGFKQFFGNLSGAENFVKKICVKGTGFGQTGVNNSQIYDAVDSKYYDIIEGLEQLKGELDLIKAVYFHPLTKGMFIDVGFRTVSAGILNELNETGAKIAQSLELIAEIETDIEVLMGNISESRNVLAANSSELEPEVVTAFSQEFDELAKYRTGENNELFSTAALKESLYTCQQEIANMQYAVEALVAADMDIYNIDSIYGLVDDAINVCRGYSASAIVFNYEGVSLGKGQSLDVIEKIRDVFENNIIKLVTDSDANISDKKITYSDLSTEKCGGNEEVWAIDLSPEALYKDFLYNRYVALNFSTFTNPNKEGHLMYEIEYILGGFKKDKDNLKTVLSELVGIRFVSNFTYIICDVEKKLECKKMAIALLGFTGVHGIIKAGQYLLLSGWAYGEAINDAKILVEGGKVPFKKTSNTWHTRLSDIVEKSVKSEKTDNVTGLDYVEYLQLMLFLENKKTKTFRTMDVMELNMIQAGYGHIRMYKYLYSLKGSVYFQYRNGEYDYMQEFDFSY